MWHKKNKMQDSIRNILVWHRLKSDPILRKEARKCARYIRLYYRKFPYPFIRCSIRLRLAGALKELKENILRLR
ncbi:MAG TPA: hypothetical protein ENL15_02370, partial [Firmicutes bacterium]|nr:hypothetical protein [Bacillota bacterium]